MAYFLFLYIFFFLCVCVNEKQFFSLPSLALIPSLVKTRHKQSGVKGVTRIRWRDRLADVMLINGQTGKRTGCGTYVYTAPAPCCCSCGCYLF